MKFTLPHFSTERLSLRPLNENDFQNMRGLDTDLEVVRYLGHGKIRSEEETRKNLDKILNDYSKHGMGLYAVEEIQTKKFIGRAGLIPWSFEKHFAWEIGYSFMKDSWGRGFATECAIFLKNWFLENSRDPYVVSFIQPKNDKSIAVAKKIGMRLWFDTPFHVDRCDVYQINRKIHLALE
jgi:ribosomal-protein-alanine N-acetyltransferase